MHNVDANLFMSVNDVLPALLFCRYPTVWNEDNGA
jgi:hypothetical protein